MEKVGNEARGSFGGRLGFIMAAAGSAVGLGNIWRFPYLAAKDNGGTFILCYVVLAFTFGFTLLTTEIAIGRKTGKSPLIAYGIINKKFRFVGIVACMIPAMILPYYSVIGGWVAKYCSVYITGNGEESATENYFDNFITHDYKAIIWLTVFIIITGIIVYCGVDKGIEKFSKILMPILLVLIISIAVFALTLSYTDENGVTRTGIDGLKAYLIPDFADITFEDFKIILMDAVGQLFYSISVAMGIMITYGSYVKKDVNLVKSINRIEIFDTSVALLAGMMIVPAVFVFKNDEMGSRGPGLMFQTLPNVFKEMGGIGNIIGIVFFVMVVFAALTSSVSILEAIVSSIIDKFGMARKKATIIVVAVEYIVGIIICLGYNKLFFSITLPNGTKGQILDILDYVSNNCMMPIVSISTCILIGWIVKPNYVIDEVIIGGYKFSRKRLYIVMIKYIAPIILSLLLLQAFNII